MKAVASCQFPVYGLSLRNEGKGKQRSEVRGNELKDDGRPLRWEDRLVSAVTNPGKTKEVREYIKRHFQAAFTKEAVRKIMKKKGLKILRSKVVPGNPPSEVDQEKTSNNISRRKAQPTGKSVVIEVGVSSSK